MADPSHDPPVTARDSTLDQPERLLAQLRFGGDVEFAGDPNDGVRLGLSDIDPETGYQPGHTPGGWTNLAIVGRR